MVSKKKEQENYERFLNTYSGNKLQSNHSLSDEGVWQIFGEDPNCDFGGHHHTPFLGLIEGKLDDVIREAVMYGGFWQWGSGGEIKKYKEPAIKKAKTKEERNNAEYEELAKLREELEAKLAKVNAKLAKLD